MAIDKGKQPNIIPTATGNIKVLFIGDIVGRPGRQTAAHFIPLIKKNNGIDLVIANGENLAGGVGVTSETYNEMIDAGVDYFTSGNHVWDKKEITASIKDNSVKILRPANYPSGTPGEGTATLKVNGQKITIINLQGRVFIPILLDDPFRVGKEIVDATDKDSITIVDIHAEATSEKIALGHYLDGRVAAVLGTHTHVQTADESILQGGTAYISDVGMCGPKDSVIGVKKEIIIKQFLTQTPQSHKVALGETIFNAVILEISKQTKKALKIERINETLSNPTKGGEDDE